MRHGSLPAVLLTICSGALAAAAGAQGEPLVRLAAPFSHHMVLPRDRPIPIWGTAAPRAEVQVDFGAVRGDTRASTDGTWSLELDALPASLEPRQLDVRATLGERRERVLVRDVLVGDVWLCTGQSNMRWRVRESAEAADVLEQADVRGLRLLDLEGSLYPSDQRYELAFLTSIDARSYYTTNGWQRASADTAAPFSAVAFAFGRRLVRELGVPIGLVHNAIGGAPMEAFVPDPMPGWLTSDAYPAWCRERVGQNLAAWFEQPTGERPHHPFEPGFLFAAGIAPLARMPIKGVIWYQGESNATDTATSPARDPARNEALLRRLIAAFRDNWDPALPFHFVQLPGIQRDWESFREVQDRVARDTDACEMVVTIDLGHPTDVHPRRKVPVGDRLAASVLRAVYERTDHPAAPRYRGHEADGATVRVDVTTAAPLRTRDHEPARGFEVAGEDRVFHPAQATLDGTSAFVSARAVRAPVAVRYAYEDDPDANVIGIGDLPLAPFRSDDWSNARRAAPDTREGFELAPVGPLREHRGAAGRWLAAPGHAEITERFAHDGRRCLHVLGGADRRVELELDEPRPTQVRMRAERWTRREPFAFRIHARVDGTWREIHDGDGVRVGARFLSTVQFDVPEGADRLRLHCTSPDDTGLLLDTIEASPPRDMAVTACVRLPWQAPLLRGRFGVADRVRLQVRGERAPRRVVACTVAIHPDLLPHIDAVRALGDEQRPAAEVTLRGERALSTGDHDLDLELRWRPTGAWRAAGDAAITRVELDDGTVHDLPFGRRHVTRVATIVRGAGDDGVHTTRIPGLVTTNAGTLIAVYDNRYRGSGDLPGDIDVGMSRSTDGGRTWQPMRVILDMGDDPAWRHDGVGDPAVLVDRETGRIWVAATWSHGDRSWNGSGPGLAPEQTGQLMLTHSDDDGLTWSQPVNITRQVKDPRWRFVLQGPGRGITMNDGTLVFAAQYRSAPDGEHQGKPFATILWSRDHGDSWQLGAGVKVDTTEAQVVELDDGVLMINCRDNRGGARSVYTTRDLGRTWRIHPSSRHALIEPVCMASLLRVDHPEHGRLLLFSNPASTRGRFDLTVKVSRDDGVSWPPSMWTTYDQRRGFGYSCLTRIDRDHVGVLYEGVRELLFQRFRIERLVR
ncbi:MAG: exo-alpha-sialidase [Planctomycetes bacterium]|nr:exo-alpha-sialidase [Planctomycetota bacterium]